MLSLDINQSDARSVIRTACRIVHPLLEVIAFFAISAELLPRTFTSVIIRSIVKRTSLCDE